MYLKDLPVFLQEIEIKIELEKDAKPKMGPIYKLSVSELTEIKIQIIELLKKRCIRPRISPWGSPIIFRLKMMEVSVCVVVQTSLGSGRLPPLRSWAEARWSVDRLQKPTNGSCRVYLHT